jgi:hypothetical protein
MTGAGFAIGWRINRGMLGWQAGDLQPAPLADAGRPPGRAAAVRRRRPQGAVRLLNSPAAVLVVAGAGNTGVSAVVETFGPGAAGLR